MVSTGAALSQTAHYAPPPAAPPSGTSWEASCHSAVVGAFARARSLARRGRKYPQCAITPQAVETEIWAAWTRLWTEWTGPRARWSSLVTRRRYPPSAGSITAPLGPVHSSPRAATADPIHACTV
eukprot:CAMPEP_0182565584 /NCGR_PEP_ID=MMETSP1324-20130603/7264_1 /TAXON_ID=236786 /ORGANISM="Florenciella sp., Strain RCC1587" /LENGTH=124 /DNA_ID=CAMNT_0024779259 /DNA_START=482 /DNA_END=853 /DNA_ORIENTATION=-